MTSTAAIKEAVFEKLRKAHSPLKLAVLKRELERVIVFRRTFGGIEEATARAMLEAVKEFKA